MKNYIKLFFIFLLIFFVILLFKNCIFSKFLNKNSMEKSNIEFSENLKKCPFKISKIVLYNNAFAENKNTTFEKNRWILDIYQYTDIAIYINNGNEKLEKNNSIQKLYLDNISIDSPKLGTQDLYYLDILNFGTNTINKKQLLQNSIEFAILNDKNEDNWVQYSTPKFFTDCSIPITLKYVNNKVAKEYYLESNELLFFDGRLLKLANISLTNLETKINLTIHIETNSNEKYHYNLSIPIKLETNNQSLYDGKLLIENKYKNLKFIKDSI